VWTRVAISCVRARHTAPSYNKQWFWNKNAQRYDHDDRHFLSVPNGKNINSGKFDRPYNLPFQLGRVAGQSFKLGHYRKIENMCRSFLVDVGDAKEGFADSKAFTKWLLNGGISPSRIAKMVEIMLAGDVKVAMKLIAPLVRAEARTVARSSVSPMATDEGGEAPAPSSSGAPSSSSGAPSVRHKNKKGSPEARAATSVAMQACYAVPEHRANLKAGCIRREKLKADKRTLAAEELEARHRAEAEWCNEK
jgi:hypothetical protein